MIRRKYTLSVLAAPLALLAVFAALAFSSCITDKFPDGTSVMIKPGTPTRLSFSPGMGSHENATRTGFDETYETFRNHFGSFFAGGDDFFDALPASTNPSDPGYPSGMAAGYGRQDDRRISTFRVLIYHAADSNNNGATPGTIVQMGNSVWNFRFDWDHVPPATSSPPFEIDVATGLYDFVFIANEQTLDDLLDVTTDSGTGKQQVEPEIATLDDLKTYLMFAHGDDIDSDKDIPMVAYYRDVQVKANNTVEFPDPDEPTNTINVTESDWTVKMRRAAIRLSFGIHMGAEQYRAWTAYHNMAQDSPGGDPGAPLLYIDGVREKDYLFPGKANDGQSAVPAVKLPAMTLGNQNLTAVTPGKIIVNPDGSVDGIADGSAEIFFDRMIYPELNLTNSASSSIMVKAFMRFDYGGGMEEKVIEVHAPATNSPLGYSLPRNTWVWISANVFTDIDYTVRVVPWGDGALPPTDILQYTLTTDQSELLFRVDGGTERLTVSTDHPDGWTISDVEPLVNGGTPQPYTIPSWILRPVANGGGGAANTTATIEVEVLPNGQNTIRTGHFTIKSGNIYKKIFVTQLPASEYMTDTPDPPTTMYVGAFWKADQYGERLIKIPRPSSGTGLDGSWAAYVIDGDDWIVLDTETSEYDGLAGNDDDFDEDHRVSGFARSVSGTVGATANALEGVDTKIYFRIGLNGAHIPTADEPVRYGTILLAYAGSGSPTTYKYQRIWVRQGERPDWLFERDENTRPNAVMFSPYNMALPEGKIFGSGGWFQIDQRSENGRSGGGAFADYPTRAGAFFQYAPDNTVVRYAWRPGTHAYTGWNNTAVNDFNPATMEVCPPGWRRPKYDTTNGVVDESGQSLWLNPPAVNEDKKNNSSWGYYADGWFDRYPLNSATTAVWENEQFAAYAGRLFYNPDGAASIFFPAAGLRNSNDGASTSAGTVSTYWTSGGKSGNVVSSVLFDETSAYSHNSIYGRAIAMATPMRCVKEDASVGVFTVKHYEPRTDNNFAWKGESGHIEVVSTNGDGFDLEWEVVGYEISTNGTTWTPVAKPDWLDISGGGNGGTEIVDVTAMAIEASSPLQGADATLRGNTAIAGTPLAPHDLSLDYNGRQNTANSYIVGGPGHYMLPLVYGNAIKDDAYNTEAYSPAAGANILSPFVAGDGPITEPDIRGVDDVTLVWMDSPGLITNVRKVEGQDYLAFDVPSYSIVQGNAVVAATDANGTVLWSWHIWVTPLVSANEATRQHDSTISSVARYKFMQSNLGWIAPPGSRTYQGRMVRLTLGQVEGGALQSIVIRQDPGGGSTLNTITDNFAYGRNPYYQWGRKDPMPPDYGPGNSHVGQYYDESTLLSYGAGYAYRKVAGSGATIDMAAQNPATFYYSNGNWHNGTVYNNLWDATNTLAGTAVKNDVSTVKTVYDPSPAGFRVPPINAWSGFTKTGVNTVDFSEINTSDASYNYGLNFHLGGWKTGPTALYPASGFRLYLTGDRSNTSVASHGWSALPYDTVSSYDYYQSRPSTVRPLNYEPRALGAFVRPVVDEDPAVLGIKAPAGVIGYYADGPQKGTLTLDGDPSTNGGIGSHDVYVAYFKWGSPVAVSSQNHGGPFSSADVVAAPAGYKGTTTADAALAKVRSDIDSADSAWLGLTAAPEQLLPGGSVVYWPADELQSGLGDPCQLFFGSWHVPNSLEFYGHVDVAGSHVLPFISVSNPAWLLEDGVKRLSAAGYRNTSGLFVNQGTRGFYWLNYADNNTNTPWWVIRRARTFHTGQNLIDNLMNSSHFAAAIRCERIYSLTVDQDLFEIPDADIRNADSGVAANVTTDHPQGWMVEGYSTNGTSVSTSHSWLGSVPAPAAGLVASPGELKIIITSVNTSGAARTGYIHLKAGTAKKVIRVNQSAARASVPAPPGVIGYYRDGANVKLTLEGDVLAGGTGQGVDVVIFKWGSLVAINNFSGMMMPYAPSVDIIATPPGFTGSTNTYSAIPYSSQTWPTADYPVSGKGDPCRYYSGLFPDDFQNKAWVTPTEAQLQPWVGMTTTEIYEPSRHTNIVWLGDAENPKQLPAAGTRGNGGFTTNMFRGTEYWSSTPVSLGQQGWGGRVLKFNDSTAAVIDNSFQVTENWAIPVRCVEAPPPPGGEMTVGNVIWAGKNLAAPGVFAANASDYGSHFVFGTNTYYTEVDFDTFTATPTLINFGIISYPAGNWSTATDPCRQGSLAAEGWRLPTQDEARALVSATGRTQTTIDGIEGYLYGVNQSEDGGRIFLPSAGTIRSSYHSMGRQATPRDMSSGYWVSDRRESGTYAGECYALTVQGNVSSLANSQSRATVAISVRCVRDKN